MLKKYKLNEEIEFVPAYFNSLTKTVINHRFRLESSFQEILYIPARSFINPKLIKDLAGMLNQLSLNTLTFQLIDH